MTWWYMLAHALPIANGAGPGSRTTTTYGVAKRNEFVRHYLATAAAKSPQRRTPLRRRRKPAETPASEPAPF